MSGPGGRIEGMSEPQSEAEQATTAPEHPSIQALRTSIQEVVQAAFQAGRHLRAEGTWYPPTVTESPSVPPAPPNPARAGTGSRASLTEAERLCRDLNIPASPRDTGRIYPVTRKVGVMTFLSELTSRGVTAGTQGVLDELAILLEPDGQDHSPGDDRQRHLAMCIYTLDGILRDAGRLNLTPEAQERLRELMIEMSRP